MNERTAVYGAAAVGVAAMATLFLLSRRPEELAPKIVGQSALGGTESLPPRVQIEIEPSAGLQRLAEADETWEYRVTDAGGRVYLQRQNADDKVRTLIVPTTYGRPAVEPRLEVWANDKRIATAPLGALPPPRVEPMSAKPDARLRAYHALDGLPTRAGNAWGWVRCVPQTPLRPHEFWTYEVLRTPLQGHPYADRAFAPRSRGAALQLLYADDVASIRVRVRNWISHEREQWVTVPRLRLVRQGGETVMGIEQPQVPNDLGLDFRLRLMDLPHGFQSDRGPDGDNRTPDVDVRSFPRPGTLRATDWYLSTKVALDESGLSRLNILGLRIGSAHWTAGDRHPGPVERRPFSLRLRLTKRWAEPAGGFETTIPVEPSRAGSESKEGRRE